MSNQPAKTPIDAYHWYADQLKSILLCVTDAHILTNRQKIEAEKELEFSFTNNPARLGRSNYTLYVVQRFKIIQDNEQPRYWKVRTISYKYSVDRYDDRQEIVSFHWEGHSSTRPDPHIHIGFAGLGSGASISPKHHIPSGRVALEDVVQFSIEEMGVTPVRISNWKALLATTKRVFLSFKNR